MEERTPIYSSSILMCPSIRKLGCFKESKIISTIFRQIHVYFDEKSLPTFFLNISRRNLPHQRHQDLSKEKFKLNVTSSPTCIVLIDCNQLTKFIINRRNSWIFLQHCEIQNVRLTKQENYMHLVGEKCNSGFSLIYTIFSIVTSISDNIGFFSFNK